MTEYEYLGRTTALVQFPGKPLISTLVSRMSLAFREGAAFADFRKPDGMGMVELGGNSIRVELLEVTTEKNFKSALKEMSDKIGALAGGGAAATPFPVEVVGTPWSPGGPNQRTCPSVPDEHNKEVARWVCFLPTLRNTLPAGVALYEVHAAVADFNRVPMEKFPEDVQEALGRNYLQVMKRIYSCLIAETGSILDARLAGT